LPSLRVIQFQLKDLSISPNLFLLLNHATTPNAIEVYIDRGWGVDALLGKQTRIHADLDVAVQHKDVAQIRVLLETRGYQDMPRDDSRDCNFVLADNKGIKLIFIRIRLIQ
jgi:lincosamide nucleotidyltransferase A/C/D/E